MKDNFNNIPRKQDRIRKNTSCVEPPHHMDHNVMSSMRNVMHLPDDFMHVKKFTNLDSLHHEKNEGLSNEMDESALSSEYDSDFLNENMNGSQMDISEQHQKFQNKKKRRSNVV